MKKNNAYDWSMSRSFHRASDPAYYIEDCRIYGEKRIKGICHHSTIEFSANFNLWWISIKSLHWKWGFSIIIWIFFYIFFFFFWQRTSWIYGCRVFGTLVGGEVSPQKTGRESTVHNRAKIFMWLYLSSQTRASQLDQLIVRQPCDS